MRVVHVKQEPCTHYIGRLSSFRFAGSGEYTGLGNPFVVGPHITREEAIARFKDWARSRPMVMQAIRNLPLDAKLGCWCSPQPCHGDAIIELWREMHGLSKAR